MSLPLFSYAIVAVLPDQLTNPICRFQNSHGRSGARRRSREKDFTTMRMKTTKDFDNVFTSPL
jgi:hypothetical protein